VERLKHYLREQAYDTKLVNAALDAPLDTLPDLVARLDALQEFMTHKAASGLVSANKRISNILRKSEFIGDNTINEDMLEIKEERMVFSEINNISTELDHLYQQANYSAALTLLAGLEPGVEAFFENVMVMDENLKIRQNRLALLAELKSLFDRVSNLALLA